jgi:NTE family protein
MFGLVLSGGGARGAYQAGVLTAVSEISASLGIKKTFSIYTGVSAGAINASFLASKADDFIAGSKDLCELWTRLDHERVFKSDALSLGRIGVQWLRDLSLGGITGKPAGPSLLDTAPLREMLLENLNFSAIQKNIEEGHLTALGLTAVDYHSSMSVTFIQGSNDLKIWQRARRYAERTNINSDHVMASAAIPVLFPPIKVADRWYGDGCIRNQAPLSAAIHLGADKLLVVGVRRQTKDFVAHTPGPVRDITVARVLNLLLNSVLLDGIELDVDRLHRINEFMDRLPANLRDQMNFKSIQAVWVHPSEDIGELAFANARKLPKFVRYLLKGLGSTEDAKEIISYLLFDPDFCTQLIEMGYRDGMAQKQQISELLSGQPVILSST